MLGPLALAAPFLVIVGYAFVQGARPSHAQRAAAHVLLFLAAGPLLLPAVVLLLGVASELLQLRLPGVSETISVSLGVVAGAWAWWGQGLAGGWMATIGPTALAGGLTWAALEAIADRWPVAVESSGRRRWVRIAVSAVASAAAFSFFYALDPEKIGPAFESFGPAIGYVVVVGAAVGAMIKTRSANDV